MHLFRTQFLAQMSRVHGDLFFRPAEFCCKESNGSLRVIFDGGAGEKSNLPVPRVLGPFRSWNLRGLRQLSCKVNDGPYGSRTSKVRGVRGREGGLGLP